jgi:glyoxylase-like metal-dependent hydrolase (beta-lactamase superfamily II)
LITSVRDRDLRANTYVCATGVDGAALVVDPGLDGAAVRAELDRRGLTARWVLLTHGHFDHIGSAHELQAADGAAVHLHGADRKLAGASNFLLMACRREQRIVVPEIDVEITDGQRVMIGDEVATFLHTPGHTPGSCCIAWRDVLFTGDTAYRGHVDRESFPGEDRDQLRASVRQLWDGVDETTTILPGHGGSATWGEVKAHNTALREFVMEAVG